MIDVGVIVSAVSLSIHTSIRPAAASREDCRMSAISLPVGGGWVGIGSGDSVRIDRDGDGSGELAELPGLLEQADGTSRRATTRTDVLLRGLVALVGALTCLSSRTSPRAVLRSRPGFVAARRVRLRS